VYIQLFSRWTPPEYISAVSHLDQSAGLPCHFGGCTIDGLSAKQLLVTDLWQGKKYVIILTNILFNIYILIKNFYEKHTVNMWTKEASLVQVNKCLQLKKNQEVCN
jgi:hypothetical protein